MLPDCYPNYLFRPAKKKMVPSDLIPALPTAGMHGTGQLQSAAPGVSPFRSPAAVFTGHRINASRHTASCYRSGPVARDGLSLARDGCSFSEPPFTGSTFPACHFASNQPPSLPVRNHAPQPRPVCPGPDRFAAWTPLQFLRPIWIAASPECLPLGTVTSLGISGKIGSAATQSAFRIRPISLRSPVLLLFPGSAPDHRSRTATFPLARCSSNLLEPLSICPGSLPASILSRASHRPFQQHLCICIFFRLGEMAC